MTDSVLRERLERRGLVTLGQRLRHTVLSPRGLAAWAGTDRLSAVPALLPDLTAGELTPASALLALLVRGDDVSLERLPREIEALHELRLLDITGTQAYAHVAILPLGQALLVCDRLDTVDSLDVVCWPDDSSYHLALSLPPGRRTRWLDLGCGSAFAPLGRPELATEILAADISTRATRYALTGAVLSGIEHVTVLDSDLGDSVPAEWRGTTALVSCNAPIPEPIVDPYRPRWLATDGRFFERMFAHAATFVSPDGMVVVHGALDALAPIVADLPGERVVVSYTPEGMRRFAIAWWSPGVEARHITARRLLTPLRPHLTHEDRLAALAGTLPAI